MFILKKIIEFILKILAQRIIVKYQPDVIGITGSVGKTSAKETVYQVLKDKFKARKNEKNYNNELGVPLTIIDKEAAGKSIIGWLAIFICALKLIATKVKDYPQILILEMGADHPGDIQYLTKLVPCKVGVITAIGPTHLEFFGSIDGVKKEKKVIVSHLKESGYAVLNKDDKNVWSTRHDTKAKILSFGLNSESMIRASEVAISGDQMGISFKLSYQGSVVPVYLPGVLGKVQVYSALAAAAIGIIYNFNLIEIAKSFKNLQALPGRMRLITGIKETRIIDDSYNSSPKAVIAALDTLVKMNCSGKKVVVLGDMLELGEATQTEHKKVGVLVAKLACDLLITVGERAKDIAHGAKEAGMVEDKIFSFASADEAKKFVQDKIKKNDLILVKGSRGMHLEKVVKEIMLEPLRASELLVGY